MRLPFLLFILRSGIDVVCREIIRHAYLLP